MERKSDDLAIGAFFDELAAQPWLGFRRRIWPRFFFHITDVQNAASILRSEMLLCRQRALAESVMSLDNASAEILGQSAPWLFDHVRLYFRPRTPTFYRNEGIRPAPYRQLGAHCPVPVALLFDSKTIAGLAGSHFSDGNLASSTARTGTDVAFLRSLDFQEIYYDQSMPIEAKGRLTSRRQAEVIVPGQVGIDALRFVATRSRPERLTLISLLAESMSSCPVQAEQILVDPNLFFGRWTYIEDVVLTDNAVRFLFNPDSETPGPFEVQFTWIDPLTGESTTTRGSLRCLGHVTVPVPEIVRGPTIHLTVHLDDALAFSATLGQVASSTLVTPL